MLFCEMEDCKDMDDYPRCCTWKYLLSVSKDKRRALMLGGNLTLSTSPGIAE